MNEEVDDRYRRESDRDSSHPSEATRLAVLRHAAELAAHAGTRPHSAPIEFRKPSANESRWRVAAFGGLAAAALAGLLIVPHFLTPSTPPTARTQPLGRLAPRAAGPATAAAPASAAATAAPTATALPRALAANVPPSRNPALGTIADARRAPMAENRARESTGAPLAQIQAAPSAARAMSPSAPAAAPSIVPAAAWREAALREAAQRGNVARLQALLADHIDINARDAMGRTALMLAVRRDQKEAVSVLLAAGADPNAADAAGTTPLAAAADAEPEIAAALRRAGAR